MRKVGYALSLGVAFAVACSSPDKQDDPARDAGVESSEDLGSAAPAEGADEFESVLDEMAAEDMLAQGDDMPEQGDMSEQSEDMPAQGEDLPAEEPLEPEPMAEAPSAQEPSPPDLSAEELLEQTSGQYTLAEQKQRFLVDQHIETARGLMDRLDYAGAEDELEAALALAPENLTAKRMLAELGTLLGRPQADFGTVPRDLADRWKIKTQQMRAEAEESFHKGQTLFARGDYDAAIAELTFTQNHIRWAPTGVDWGGLDVEAAQLLERAKQARLESAAEAERLAQEEAWNRLRAEEELEKQRTEAQVDTLVGQAVAAFAAGDYAETQNLANQVLHRDPRNSKAQELKDTAFRAERRQVRETYLSEKRERFLLWEEYLRESTVPYTETITLPNRDYWQDITEKRLDRSMIDLSEVLSPEDVRLAESLAETRIPGLDVQDEESLDAVVDILRTFTGLPLVVHPAAEAAAIDEGVVFNYQLRNPLTVEQALNIITADAGPEVTWTIRNEAVIVTTREKARGKPTIVNHDVQDLVFGLTDFLGPRIDKLRLLDDLEDDDGGGPFGGIGEHPNLIEIASLMALIQENVAVGTWEEDGISIDEGEGYVLVVHSPEVQNEVRRFLDDLRRFTSSLVTIESKFLTIEDNYLQEIGVDFRGLDNPGSPFTDLDDVSNGLEDMSSAGLDNLGTGSNGAGASGAPSSGFFYDDGQDGDFKGRIENMFDGAVGSALSNVGGIAIQYTFLNDLELSTILTAVEKTSKIQLVNDQLLSVHNTQRAYVSVVNQRAYIQDFDVEVAQFQSIADPQINVLTEGVVLDVRPTILHNRRYLRLEIQPTVANVRALRSFSTTLGGGTQPVEFQLPELEVQSVFTTAVLPDGGSILLGGLSNIRNIERRSEVPWIGKVPIVGFFFRQDGYSDERKSLMILIRAHIVDVKDELRKFEAQR